MTNQNYDTEEGHLLAQIAAGHEEAFRNLFNRYNQKLFSYILGFIKSPQVAEELVMDVFLKIWMGKEIATQIQNFDAFVFRVAHNKAIDFLRSAAADPGFRELLWDAVAAGSDFADTAVLSREFEEKVREAVALLSGQRKKVYELSRDYDMSHDQIARHLGLSKNTVNNHITEAKRFIRSYLVKNLDIAYVLLIMTATK